MQPFGSNTQQRNNFSQLWLLRALAKMGEEKPKKKIKISGEGYQNRDGSISATFRLPVGHGSTSSTTDTSVILTVPDAKQVIAAVQDNDNPLSVVPSRKGWLLSEGLQKAIKKVQIRIATIKQSVRRKGLMEAQADWNYICQMEFLKWMKTPMDGRSAASPLAIMNQAPTGDAPLAIMDQEDEDSTSGTSSNDSSDDQEQEPMASMDQEPNAAAPTAVMDQEPIAAAPTAVMGHEDQDGISTSSSDSSDTDNQEPQEELVEEHEVEGQEYQDKPEVEEDADDADDEQAPLVLNAIVAPKVETPARKPGRGVALEDLVAGSCAFGAPF